VAASKPKFRKLILRNGRKLLQQVQKGIGRASLIGDQPFFGREHFPWAKHIEDNWHIIREELDEILKHRDDLPNFQDISPDQKHLAKEDNWKTFFFFAYGLRAPGNCARAPRTMQLLETIPGGKTAFFSILSPRMHIPAHCGPYKGVVRYHLGLKVPEPKEQCRIRVADQVAHWEEGKSMFFDDTFEHEVWNDTGRPARRALHGRAAAVALADVVAQQRDHQGYRGLAIHPRREKEPRSVGAEDDGLMALIQALFVRKVKLCT
jgi:beta-hydroxylase